MTRFTTPVFTVIWGLLSFALVAACGERTVRPDARERDEQGSVLAPPQPSVVASASAPLPASAAPSTPADVSAEAKLVLPIPPREHAPEAPPAGWCGETAIQEGLLHFGVWAPQRIIHKAGRPTHPDLYSPDVPVALSELGVKHSSYAGSRGDGMFEQWIRRALDEGDPVLAGVKILPTIHPEWGLDHFVLVVGYGDRGLLVNTTWGHRLWVADTTAPGLSFKNAFYAIRLGGVSVAGLARAARLSLLAAREGEANVEVRVTCTGLQPGSAVRIELRRARLDEAPAWSQEVTATGDRVTKEVTVDADRVARFQCVSLP